MSYDIEKLTNDILESYEKYGITNRLTQTDNINRGVVTEVTEKLISLLFPGFFDSSKIQKGYVKYTVGEKLEFIQYNLKKQIARSLGTKEICEGCPRSETLEQAEKIVEQFLQRIPYIREMLQTDVQATYDGDPAATNTDEVIVSYPGVFAITVYRIAHELFRLGVPMIPRIMTEYAHSKTGIDIHPGATIGKYFFIDHGTGIVVGETTEIGDNVKLYQGVTLGALSTKDSQALRSVKRHPTIENNVTIYSGATVLGGKTVIGEGTTIGGNCFITSSIPTGARVMMPKPELVIEKGNGPERS